MFVFYIKTHSGVFYNLIILCSIFRLVSNKNNILLHFQAMLFYICTIYQFSFANSFTSSVRDFRFRRKDNTKVMRKWKCYSSSPVFSLWATMKGLLPLIQIQIYSYVNVHFPLPMFSSILSVNSLRSRPSFQISPEQIYIL